MSLLIPLWMVILPASADMCLGPQLRFIPGIIVISLFALGGPERWVPSTGYLVFVLAQMAAALIFFAWNSRLFLREIQVPKRTYVLFVAAVVLHIFWYAQVFAPPSCIGRGIPFVINSFRLGASVWFLTSNFFAVNCFWVAALGIMFTRSWKKEPSFKNNLFLHWALFAWLAWSALPVGIGTLMR